MGSSKVQATKSLEISGRGQGHFEEATELLLLGTGGGPRLATPRSDAQSTSPLHLLRCLVLLV